MRRAVVAAGMAATLVLLAGCGGPRPVPLATPALASVPTPAPTAEVTPEATADPVPMAVSQLVPPTPSPTAAAPAPAPTPRPVQRPTAAPVPSPQPPVIISRVSPPVAAQAQPARVVSDNWSGYVARGGGFWQVSGSWTEPTVRCTAATSESVFWVGLGGYPSYPLYQAGSGAFCRNGVPIHALWYELLTPGNAAPLVALVQISAGDRISASLSLRSGAAGGQVHLVDETSGYARDVSFSPAADSLGSAEWVTEATSHGGTVSTLADFGSVSFAGCSANLGAAGVATWPAEQLIELTLSDRSGGQAAPGPIGASAGGGGFPVSYLGA